MLRIVSMALVLLVCATVQAREWPTRPIDLLVGFTPGGSVDIAARLIGEKLGARFGQPVIVENRPGAAGNIAAGLAARAPHDGYTVYVATSVNAVSPHLYKKLSYDPVKDFAPVCRWITTAYILVVNPALPVHSVQDLVAYAKANPGKLNFGSTGIGSPAHLAGELLDLRAGIKMTHVPFKGGPEAMSAILGGQVQLTFAPIPVALPLMRSGRIRALAITSLHPSKLVPDLPTVAQQGFPGFQIISWYGAMVPAGTPKPIIDRLSEAMQAVLATKDVSTKLAVQGLEPAPLSPSHFADFFKHEIDSYSELMAKAKIPAL